MNMVYRMSDDGRTTAMKRTHCKNEDRELQQILELNPNLLPGDQINPEDPRRWLLVKREMPVPNPAHGVDSWSVDFLFADQDGVPTFVECKRFADTRSRREVVGQMLEYAANGHHYWSREELHGYARQSAALAETTIEKRLESLRPSDGLDAEEFFDVVQQNLREGQLRIVFFLEESPMELRSVVDFLNPQMERTEVLLVEARQYLADGVRIVVPTLFGYTEAARMVKRPIVVQPSGSRRRRWDREAYFTEVAERLSADEAGHLERLYAFALELGCQVTWGTGIRTGSFNIKELTACPRSLITCNSDGNLSFNFGWLGGSEIAELVQRRFRQAVREGVGLPIGEDTDGYTVPVRRWGTKLDAIKGALEQVVRESRAAARRAEASSSAEAGLEAEEPPATAT